jgi:hypothetical protein
METFKTGIPNRVYRLGVERNIPLPRGYFSTSDEEFFWLQKSNSTGGILIEKGEKGVEYYLSKTSAERTIKKDLRPIVFYEFVED